MDQAAYMREWRARQPATYRERRAARMREWREANPEKLAAVRLRARLGKYGLTPDEYMAKILSQGDCCAACGTGDPGTSYGVWCIDHDRSCCPGKFSCGTCLRDLLCNGCNAALGHAHDDAERLRSLASYVERWRKP